MTDERQIIEAAGDAARRAMPMLPLTEWAALPLPVRVADKLVEVLIIASELRAELDRDDAHALASVVPEIDHVVECIDDVLQRLVS